MPRYWHVDGGRFPREFDRVVDEERRWVFAEEAGEVTDPLSVLVQGDGTSRTGVTELTKVHADMLCFVMADAFAGLLADHAVTGAEVRSMLEGHDGAAVVRQFMIGELRKLHPLFRE